MAYTDLRKGRDSQPGRAYFVTTVAAGRARCFEDLGLARIVISQMRRLHDEGAVDSLAFALMPDHLHWLFTLGERLGLSEVMRRFKGRSARQVNAALGRSGPLWQPAFHDHALRAEEELADVARYIVANPLRAGLVTRLGDYPHWDAVWL